MANYLDRCAVVKMVDGGISITHLSYEDMEKYGFVNEDDFISYYMNRVAPGKQYSFIQRSEIPADRSNRKHWKFSAGKISLDQAKVNAEKAKKDRLAELKGKGNFSSQEISEILKEYIL